MASYETVPTAGFTQTTFEGVLDVVTSTALLRQMATDADVRGRHLFVNLRAATTTGLSFGDVYRLVGIIGETPDAFSGRIALVDTFRESFEKVQFFEASATAKGFSVRAFLDDDRAVAWLEQAA